MFQNYTNLFITTHTRKFLLALFLFLSAEAALHAQSPEEDCPDSLMAVSDPSICHGGNATIVVESTKAEVEYTLRNNSDNTIIGNPIKGNGGNLNFSVSPTTTTTYNILAKHTVSECTAVLDDLANVTVIERPKITSTKTDSGCGSEEVNLSAKASAGELHWYDAENGGNHLSAGPTFTTPKISSTTTYYVEAVDQGCPSASRTAVTATINPLPSKPSVAGETTICSGNDVTLTASGAGSGARYRWYDALTGGTPLHTGTKFSTPVLTTTTTYHVDATVSGCTGLRTTVTINVDPSPSAPTVAGTKTICAGNQITLTANSTGGGSITYEWYNTASGGNSIHTGSILETAVLNTSTTYYVDAKLGDCTSSRTAVTVKVNAIPQAPAVSGSVSICDGNSTTLTASGINGADYEWYDAPTGGKLLYTGTKFTSPVLNAETTYYVQATLNNCTGPRKTVTVTVNPIPSAPVVTGVKTICSGNSTTLTAAGATGETFKWYTAASGGTALHTGEIFNSPSLNKDITYYVEATAAGCTSPRTEVAITVNATPAAPKVTGTTTICAGNATTLTADGTGGAEYQWFDTASGGTLLHTGATFSTPVLTDETTYYVDATANGCRGPRAPVKVTVNQIPAVPTIAGTTTICSGSATTLTASGITGATYKWYEALTGGTVLHTGAVFPTKALNDEITYFVDATLNGCTGAKASVKITVNPIPAAPTVTGTTVVCSGNAATLTANGASGAVFKWYDASTGGKLLQTGATFNTPVLNDNTTYYVDVTVDGCTSSRTTVAVAVNATPAAPAVAGTKTICAGSAATLTASGTTGATYQWYDKVTGGTVLHTGAGFTTPPLNSKAEYYVDATQSGCTGTRTAVEITVISTPAAPTVSGVKTICSGSSTTLTAEGINGATYKWFDASNGGNLKHTGESFNTPALSGSTTYYVEATLAIGCTGPRTAVTVTVNPIPAAPSVSGKTAICSGTVTTLTADDVKNATYKWYEAATGGNALETGAKYTTPVLTATTTYYVDATVAGCAGARTAVTITVNPIPAVPSISGTTTICSGNSTILTAGGINGAEYHWYNASTGGSLLNTGNTYTTPDLTTNATYYVAATTAAGCTGSRASVTVTVNNIPAVPTASGVSICSGNTASLTASGINGATYKWYDESTGGKLLQTGAGYTTPVLNNTTTYYVDATTASGCTSSRKAVTVSVNDIPPGPTVTGDKTICYDNSTTLTATSTFKDVKFNWYSVPTGGTALYTGSAYATPPLGSTTKFYVDATSAAGCVGKRQEVTVFVTTTQAPTVSGNKTICSGFKAVLTAAVSGGSAYRWYDAPSSGTLLFIGATYTTPALISAKTYYVDATASGCTGPRTTVTVNVNTTQAPSISGTTTICAGNTTNLTAGGVSGATYKWYDVPNSGTVLHTGSTYTTPVLNANKTFYAEAISGGGCISSRSSVSVQVNNSAAISTQPLNANGCVNSSVAFSVVATGTSLSYQWMIDKGSGFTKITDNALYSGSTNATLIVKVNNGMNGHKFRCVITSACSPATSNTAALSINAATTIATQPASVTSCSGNDATFTVSANGGSLSYQWQINNGSSYSDISNGATYNGVTTATLSVKNLSASLTGSKYRCFISSATCGTSIHSDPADLVVNSVTKANAGIDQDICTNSTVINAAPAVIGTGTWKLISGSGNITNPAKDTTSVTGLANGLNKFVWTIQNSNCISSDTLDVMVSGPVTLANAGADQNVCSTVGTLIGNKPLVGTGQWTLVSGTGNIANINDSSTSVSALSTGKNVFLWTIKNGACTSSDAVIIEVVSPPTIAKAEPDQITCSASATLKANKPVIGTGKWTVSSGTGNISNVNDNETTVTSLSTGKNVFVWTIMNGTCSSSDSLVIDVTGSPSKANAGPDQAICANKTNLKSNGPLVGLGQWSLISGSGNITNINDSTTLVSSLGIGKNIFVWTITNSICTSKDSVVVEVLTPPTKSKAGSDQIICSNATSLKGNKPVTGIGEWTLFSGVGKIADVNDSTTSVSSLNPGKNIFVWTIKNGSCTSSDSVVVEVLAAPTKANAGVDQTICSNNVNLIANEPVIGEGRWTVVSGAGKFADSSLYNSRASGLMPGNNIFRWTISNGLCPSSIDDITVTVLPKAISTNVGPDITVCADTVRLAAVSSASGNGIWSILSGNGTIISPTNDTTLVSQLSIGKNTFVWEISSFSCGTAKDTVVVTRNASPDKANAGADQEVCYESITLAANNPSIGTGKWKVVSGSSSLINDNAFNSVLNLTTGETVLAWTISNVDCPVSSSDTVKIIRLAANDAKCAEVDEVVIPGGFSPNGDGINDLLVIQDIERYPNAVVRVYNRWGILVFEKQNYNNDWDGTSNVKGLITGGKLLAGTYFIYVDLNNGKTMKATYLVIKY